MMKNKEEEEEEEEEERRENEYLISHRIKPFEKILKNRGEVKIAKKLSHFVVECSIEQLIRGNKRNTNKSTHLILCYIHHTLSHFLILILILSLSLPRNTFVSLFI
jgi:hypothetical protein